MKIQKSASTHNVQNMNWKAPQHFQKIVKAIAPNKTITLDQWVHLREA